VDSDDNILVADSEAIYVFRSDGTHLKTIGQDVFRAAAGVCMDKSGRIIACDGMYSEIFVF